MIRIIIYKNKIINIIKIETISKKKNGSNKIIK